MTSNSKPDLLAARSFPSLLPILGSVFTKCLEACRAPNSTNDESMTSETLQFLAAGKSGVVYAVDPKRVLKEYHDSDGAEIEHRAYRRLSPHPNIAKLLGIRPDGSIILERGECLRTFHRSYAANEIPFQTKLGWLVNAAKGYEHAHDHAIIVADVGCQNQILTSDGIVKIIDFEGCSIDGEPADSCYEWFSYRPSTPRVSRATDIFAYGCAVYEVMTGRPPHHELEPFDDKYKQVEELYVHNQFPDVTNLPLSGLIHGCWHENFGSMSEIIKELEGFRASFQDGSQSSSSALGWTLNLLLVNCYQRLVKPFLDLLRQDGLK